MGNIRKIACDDDTCHCIHAVTCIIISVISVYIDLYMYGITMHSVGMCSMVWCGMVWYVYT